jgi:hypothetical protein
MMASWRQIAVLTLAAALSTALSPALHRAVAADTLAKQNPSRVGQSSPSGDQSSLPPASLPPVFVGCWQSVTHEANEGVESIQTVGPYAWQARCVIPPGTTRFCYIRTKGGRFEPLLFDGDVTPQWTARQQMTDLNYRLEILSTDGQSTARLRGRSHHVEFGKRTLDQTWEMNCRIAADRMYCRDRSDGTLNGQPWCFSKTHYVFTRVPQ